MAITVTTDSFQVLTLRERYTGLRDAVKRVFGTTARPVTANDYFVKFKSLAVRELPFWAYFSIPSITMRQLFLDTFIDYKYEGFGVYVTLKDPQRVIIMAEPATLTHVQIDKDTDKMYHYNVGLRGMMGNRTQLHPHFPSINSQMCISNQWEKSFKTALVRFNYDLLLEEVQGALADYYDPGSYRKLLHVVFPYKECSDCGRSFTGMGTMTHFNGKDYCKECMIKCRMCGNYAPKNFSPTVRYWTDTRLTHGKEIQICQSCADIERPVECAWCNTTVLSNQRKKGPITNLKVCLGCYHHELDVLRLELIEEKIQMMVEETGATDDRALFASEGNRQRRSQFSSWMKTIIDYIVRKTESSSSGTLRRAEDLVAIYITNKYGNYFFSKIFGEYYMDDILNWINLKEYGFKNPWDVKTIIPEGEVKDVVSVVKEELGYAYYKHQQKK